MARLWLRNPDPAPEPDRRGTGRTEGPDPQDRTPTHQRYQIGEDGKPTAHVNCYCTASADHPV